MSIASTLAALRLYSDGATIAQLVATTGLTKQSICESLGIMRLARKAHIDRWGRTTKAPRAIWVAGRGVDCPKPAPLRGSRARPAPEVRVAALTKELAGLITIIEEHERELRFWRPHRKLLRAQLARAQRAANVRA